MVNFFPNFVCSNVERVKLTAFCKAFYAALCVCACGKKFLNHCNFNVKLFLSELQEIEWYNPSDNDGNKSFTTFYNKKSSLINDPFD